MPQVKPRTPQSARRVKRKPLSDRKNRKASPGTGAKLKVVVDAPPVVFSDDDDPFAPEDATPSRAIEEDTPFSKAEALAAAAAHVLTLRHQRAAASGRGRPPRRDADG